MHYLTLRASMTLVSQAATCCDMVRRSKTHTQQHKMAERNSNLLTKMKKWTGINAAMHQKDIFQILNRKKVLFQ